MPTRTPDRGQGIWPGLGWLLLVLLLLAQVWVLYLLVPGEGEPYVAHQDKVGHLLLFGVPFALALLLTRPVALGILAHALASEPLQWLLTTRTVDAWDTVANLVGIGLAALLVVLVRRVPGRDTVPEPAAVGGAR